MLVFEPKKPWELTFPSFLVVITFISHMLRVQNLHFFMVLRGPKGGFNFFILKQRTFWSKRSCLAGSQACQMSAQEEAKTLGMS